MHQAAADALFDAFESGQPIDPLTDARPSMPVEDAYVVQQALIARHAGLGRSVVGHKVGLTSLAMQRQLGLDTPDFGVVLDSHTWSSDARIDLAALRAIAPKIEAEIAFVLSAPLSGPGLSVDDVLAVTESVVPVFEVIDSRVRDWKIKLADTVSDNASCFGAVVGAAVALGDVAALDEISVAFSRDGEVVGEGRGDAVLGHPAKAVAWLAEALDGFGEAVPAGQPILAGALCAAVDATPGHYVASFDGGLGEVSVDII